MEDVVGGGKVGGHGQRPVQEMSWNSTLTEPDALNFRLQCPLGRIMASIIPSGGMSIGRGAYPAWQIRDASACVDGAQ